jgi:hypothetical protein
VLPLSSLYAPSEAAITSPSSPVWPGTLGDDEDWPYGVVSTHCKPRFELQHANHREWIGSHIWLTILLTLQSCGDALIFGLVMAADAAGATRPRDGLSRNLMRPAPWRRRLLVGTISRRVTCSSGARRRANPSDSGRPRQCQSHTACQFQTHNFAATRRVVIKYYGFLAALRAASKRRM